MRNIETERLLLRKLQLSDASKMYELDSNTEVHRYLGNRTLQKVEQAEEVIRNILRQYIENGIGRWATIEKSTGDFIGWSGLKFVTEKENNHVNYYDVGYRFIPRYWGKGYATESTKAALEYAFTILNLEEVIGTCHEENKASRNVLGKCGLKFVEKFQYKNFLTCDWLMITREEWMLLINNRS